MDNGFVKEYVAFNEDGEMMVLREYDEKKITQRLINLRKLGEDTFEELREYHEQRRAMMWATEQGFGEF